MINDRYKLNQFYQGKEFEIEHKEIPRMGYSNIDRENIKIIYSGKSSNSKQSKEIYSNWIEAIKKLHNVKKLKINLFDEGIFNAVCEMKNLEELIVEASNLKDFSPIIKLKKLTRFELSYNKELIDIKPITRLKLKQVSFLHCFNITNYELLGDIPTLIGLSLCGNWTAPKNLKLSSLKPYEKLKNLKHLDISTCSIVDKSFESIIKMKSLERFDFSGRIKKVIREKIKENHLNLKAGFFMDYDYEKNEFYDGKNWEH